MSQTSTPAVDVPANGYPAADVRLETRRGRLVVRFEGDVDAGLRARFDRLLAVVRVAHEPVEVECRDVTGFGADGVRMLMLLLAPAGGPGVVELRSTGLVEAALRSAGVDRYPAP